MFPAPIPYSVRFRINDPDLGHINVLDEDGNLWTLQDPGIRYWLELPRFSQELVLYLPSPLYPTEKGGLGTWRLVYPPGMSLIDVYGAIVTFYNRPLSKEERHLALKAGYDRWLPQLRSDQIVTVGDLFIDIPIFEDLIPYLDGFTPLLGR